DALIDNLWLPDHWNVLMLSLFLEKLAEAGFLFDALFVGLKVFRIRGTAEKRHYQVENDELEGSVSSFAAGFGEGTLLSKMSELSLLQIHSDLVVDLEGVCPGGPLSSF
ncbi:hypothetical protein FOZ63_021330, partial [Perkinsus olseni]